ncbi:MAG: phosphate ABC transporter substrate-binding protein [bacterium]|nr:phosphate ABC transporter substrate-binding protein [bacterium]
MKVRNISAVILLSLLVVLPLHAQKQLKWVGCGITKKAFMKELGKTYEKKTGVKIVIVGGGATMGIRVPAKGEADFGGTCRHKINVPEEKAATLHHVAWDALVVIANKNHPVDNLSIAQVKGILTGKIKNWREVGGNDAPIKLFIRTGKTSGVGLMTRELIFSNPGQDYSPGAEMKKSSGPVEAAISRDKLGIGITGVSSAKKRLNYLKMLKIEGAAPTKENIKTGKYAFFRPLYLATKGEPTGELKKFIDFALSPEGQKTISDQGTVNLEEGKPLLEKFKTKYKGKFLDPAL